MNKKKQKNRKAESGRKQKSRMRIEDLLFCAATLLLGVLICSVIYQLFAPF